MWVTEVTKVTCGGMPEKHVRKHAAAVSDIWEIRIKYITLGVKKTEARVEDQNGDP